MSIDESMVSCGVHQLYELDGTPADLIQEVQDNMYPDDGHYNDRGTYVENSKRPACAMYVFSDTVNRGNHVALRKYILKQRLGSVSISRPRKNPNTGNMIQLCVWTPNFRRLAGWKPNSKR